MRLDFPTGGGVINKEFSDCLREYVSSQKQKNPALSEVALSKRTGIPPTTFNRLVNGHSQPSITTLSKLLKHIPALKNCLPKEIGKAFEVVFEKAEENSLPKGNGLGAVPDFESGVSRPGLQSTKYVQGELENMLSDKHAFLCYVLALSKKRMSKEEIQYNFGQKGLKALDNLVRKNLLSKENDNSYKINEDHIHIALSFKSIKKYVMFLLEQYDPDDVQDNYIHEDVAGLNEEGLDKLLKTHKEFHKKVASIMGNKNYKGDMPVFSIACADMVAKPMEANKFIEDTKNTKNLKDLIFKPVQQKGEQK